MNTLTSKAQIRPMANRASLTMATFTALALMALSASVSPAHADPRGQIEARESFGGQGYHESYHEDQFARADPIFKRIDFTRARIDRLSDHRAISRFEARRLNDRLDDIAFDARLALRGPRTDHRLLASADLRLERLTDRLDEARFRRADWRG